MKLVSIKTEEFKLWSIFRLSLYSALENEYNVKEMESIHIDDKWHCQFIENDKGEKIGLVEISLRNIVDGCLTSPVAYLEGLFLIESERNKGQGTKVIKLIIAWCKSSGYEELATDTEINNTKAQKFYSKLGFEEVDRVIEYRLDLKKHSKGACK